MFFTIEAQSQSGVSIVSSDAQMAPFARHIDRPRLREDKKLRRVAYSASFRRVCTPNFSWTSPFASRWRTAVAEVATRYGYAPSDSSRRWIWNYYREIMEVASKLDVPSRDFHSVPRTVSWRSPLWTVLRLPENPDLFVLQQPAEGDERFNACGPISRVKALYTTVTEHVWRGDFQRLTKAERLSQL